MRPASQQSARGVDKSPRSSCPPLRSRSSGNARPRAAQGPSTTGTEDRLLLDAAAALSDAQIHRTRNHAQVVIDVLQRLELPSGSSGSYHSLPLLEKKGVAKISRLPVSLRILLESVLRNLDGGRIRDQDVLALAAWKPHGPRVAEVPFFVGRVLLQDFTGVPLLVDLAAMRSAVARRGREVTVVQPHVRVDCVIDHSVQVDYFARADALRLNMEMEFHRNGERYRFLKWGAGAFDGLRIVPPGFGICHQVNLEFLAQGVLERRGVPDPDTLVGTDLHAPWETCRPRRGDHRIHRAAEVVRSSGRALGRVSRPVRKRARRQPRRMRTNPRGGPAGHGDAALQRARYAPQRRPRPLRVPDRPRVRGTERRAGEQDRTRERSGTRRLESAR